MSTNFLLKDKLARFFYWDTGLIGQIVSLCQTFYVLLLPHQLQRQDWLTSVRMQRNSIHMLQCSRNEVPRARCVCDVRKIEKYTTERLDCDNPRPSIQRCDRQMSSFIDEHFRFRCVQKCIVGNRVNGEWSDNSITMTSMLSDDGHLRRWKATLWGPDLTHAPWPYGNYSWFSIYCFLA